MLTGVDTPSVSGVNPGANDVPYGNLLAAAWRPPKIEKKAHWTPGVDRQSLSRCAYLTGRVQSCTWTPLYMYMGRPGTYSVSYGEGAPSFFGVSPLGAPYVLLLWPRGK